MDLPQTDITGIIAGLISSLGSELGSVLVSVRAMIPVLEKSPIGWYIAGVLVLDEIFATLLTTIYLMVTPFSWNDLNPFTIGSFVIQSNQILSNPQSTHEQKLQAIAWIQASKLTNDVLTTMHRNFQIININN